MVFTQLAQRLLEETDAEFARALQLAGQS